MTSEVIMPHLTYYRSDTQEKTNETSETTNDCKNINNTNTGDIIFQKLPYISNYQGRV
jgi:DNA uptake protein ComE-like DNA-binding protein